MGQGQSEVALSLLKQCASEGKWLCIQNLHLAIGWIPVLESELQSSKPHEKFKLFLTAEAHERFSPVLLEKCAKITLEAPPGIKRNLQRTLDGWSEEFLSSGTVLRAQCLFSVAWFHAVVQELRSYIPQGWSKFYDFSIADLASAAAVVESFMKNTQLSPPWHAIRGLLKNAIYGGKVENKFDFERLSIFLEMFFNHRKFDSRSCC